MQSPSLAQKTLFSLCLIYANIFALLHLPLVFIPLLYPDFALSSILSSKRWLVVIYPNFPLPISRVLKSGPVWSFCPFWVQPDWDWSFTSWDFLQLDQDQSKTGNYGCWLQLQPVATNCLTDWFPHVLTFFFHLLFHSPYWLLKGINRS